MEKSKSAETRKEVSNMHIKAISLDWENCCGEGKNIPWSTQKIAQLATTLRLLSQMTGMRFFLNTGRPVPYMEAALQALGIVTNTPSIAENGSILYYPETGKYKINPAITPRKLAVLRKITGKLEEIVMKKDGIKELGKEFSFSTNPPRRISMEDYFHLIHSEIIKINKDAWQSVEITHSQSAVDITIKDVNKESGLKFWCQSEELDVSELAGLGDSRGDWPVLEKVALPMCPANATPETKKLVEKRGGYISSFPTTLGVIDAIGYLSNRKSVRVYTGNILASYEKQINLS